MPENGDRDGNVRQLEAYLDEHPDSERFAELAELLVEGERFGEAVKFCEKGIGFHPDLAAGHAVYGKALISLDMLDEGIQAFERACALRQNDVGLLAEVGKFLADAGQREAAFPYLEKGREIDAEDPRIMHLEAELGGAVPADHERVETVPLDGDQVQLQQTDQDEPDEPGLSDDDDQDDDSLRVPTDRISWPAWESQPPPAKDAFASEDDEQDEDDEENFEPPTVYTQNPLAAQASADERHPPLSGEFESAETVEVAEAEELAMELERQQQETVMDDEAGLTSEVDEAVNQAAAPPGEPPTMFDPDRPEGASPWAAEDSSVPEKAEEPPTMFEGSQSAASDAEPPPTKFTGSPGGAVVSYHQTVDEPAEHFSYLKVFLVLVPFLVVGLGLGGYVAYRHIRSEKINSLLDQVLTSISQDTFLGYSNARSTIAELLDLDEENPRGPALAALVSTRLHDEYGPNLTLKEEGQRILEQEKSTPHNAVDLLWTRFHLKADDLESDVKNALEKSPGHPQLLGLAGEVAASQGKFKEALELLERNLKEEPSSVRTLYILADLEIKSGKIKKSIEHLERALAINGIHVRSLLVLSGLRLQLNDQLDRSKTDLEKILELPQVTSRRRAEAHFLLAKWFFKGFERTRGIAEVKAASELLPDDNPFQIRLAKLCRENFELEEAAKRAGKVLEVDPNEIETRLLLIGSDLPRGRIQKVKQALNKLIGQKVPAAPFLVLRGEALLLSGQYAKALSDLSSVKPGTPQKPRARALAILARLGVGDTDGAYRAAKVLLADHRGSALAHFAMGQVRLSKRMTTSATTSFKMAVELDPRCYQALTLLAHLADERHRADEEAESFAALALRANPHALEARKLLGRLKLEKGDAEGALKEFARAVMELETSREGFVGMAEALLLLNQVDKAHKAIQKAREVGAADAHAFWVEGRIHMARGKFFPAVRALTKAKRQEDKDPEILADLGLAQLGARSLTRAEKTLKDSLKRRRLLRAQEGLAKVYREKRKYKDAAKAFSSAAYLAKKKGWKSEDVAGLYIESGKAWVSDRRTKNRYAQARFMFRKASKLKPDDTVLLYMIAETYDREEKLSSARRAYLDVLKQDPNHSKSLYRLGLIEYDEGSDKRAKEYLERFLKTGAKGRDASRARKLLGKIK